MGCSSNVHRCYGVCGDIRTPACNVERLKKCFDSQLTKSTPGFQAGWSQKYVLPNTNGAVLPSCLRCRNANLVVLFGGENAKGPCNDCQDWDLLKPKQTRNDALRFPIHKDYPTSYHDGSPIPAPEGRDVFEEGAKLPVVKITWKFMIQASKFAFYQASRAEGPWNKCDTVCYLKNCGISTDLAGSLHDAAAKARNDDSVEYHLPDRIGQFMFDPAWLSEEIEVQDYIEAFMHHLFLGVTKSNFELFGIWLTQQPPAAKLGHTTFLNVLQVLLKDLRPFGLSWLQAYPLTGTKGKLGTGSWVADNWQFFARISQYIFGWCARDGKKAFKYGVEDMSRVVISFHCFLARVMTHAGVDTIGLKEAELYLKEFLSSIREFDVRVRHSKLGTKAKKLGELKSTEAYWLKANYMALSNLLAIILKLGPLVLWWDGGGRGERFIQCVKPLIKLGVRGDALNFFADLLERLFKNRTLEMFSSRFGFRPEDGTSEPEEKTLFEALNEIIELMAEESGDEEAEAETVEVTHAIDSESSDDWDSFDSENEEDVDEGVAVGTDKTQFSVNQVFGMTKKKVFYIYKNQEKLERAIASKKPLAGIVEVTASEGGAISFEFQVVFRKPVKLFARRRVAFDDGNGLSFHGLWCSPLSVEEAETLPATNNLKEIQTIAKLAAVAIPLWCIVGKDKPDSFKYCVMTNWWKYRMSDGVYRLPKLDPNLYKSAAAESQSAASLLASASRPPSGKKDALKTFVI